MSNTTHSSKVDFVVPDTKSKAEYFKFGLVIVAVCALAWLHAQWRGVSLMQAMESFMGVFFLVFAGFKFTNVRAFAYGLKSYVGIGDKPLWWGYVFPFVQLAFAGLYLFGATHRIVDGLALLWSIYWSLVVWRTLRSKGQFHCVCLGNVIKLPLSTTSFVEDFGMALMAGVMLVLR